MQEENRIWSVTNPPPEGHKDVSKWAWGLFQMAAKEKDRLRLKDTWKRNYSLYRGDQWGIKKRKDTLSINLFFSNVQRTVANITSRKPIAECIDLKGEGDGADKRLTMRLRKWWQETNQQSKLRMTTQKSEKYGITIEKAVWDRRKRAPGIIIVDPYAWFPAPGFYEDPGADLPFACHAYPDNVDALEAQFKTTGIKPSPVYSIMGEDREDAIPTVQSGSYSVDGKVVLNDLDNRGKDYKDTRALAVEVWVRDYTKISDDSGNKILKYPGGIRVITVTNEGDKLLADKGNPSINPNLDRNKVKSCYLYDRFPFYIANSYEDTTSNWGFSAADQIADVVYKISELVSRITKYIMRSMTGILVIPPKSGITKNQLSSDPGLVLFPDTLEAANAIRVVPMPALSPSFFQVLDMLMGLYDRVYAIQDADRGQNPAGVRAASALVALQERNQVLIQHKINGIDYLVSQRGQCAISLWQNHGHQREDIEVEGAKQVFRGTDYLGREFAYVVEAGSTIHKTEVQRQEQAIELYDRAAIDQEALLETLNFPDYKKILERMGEKQLEQAMAVLVQAGLPEDAAAQLYEVLMQSQGGPGDKVQNPPRSGGSASPETQPGTPTAFTGEYPPQEEPVQ